MESNQETMSRLKFISKLKKGEKINTKYMYVQPDGFGTSLYRTFCLTDNRTSTLNFLSETIMRAFDILSSYEKSTNEMEQILYNNIIDDLQKSVAGLTNIKSTYSSDTKFLCDIETLLQYINARLSRFSKIDDE